MYSTVRTMSQRLVSAKMAIVNALAEEDIRNSLMLMGMGEAQLQTGLELYQKAEGFYQQQRREYTEQYLASEALNVALEEAKKEFRMLATAAKLALMDSPTLLHSLGLDGRRAFSLADWVTLARTFYGTALQSPVILEKLSEYAVTVEKLQAGVQLVDRVEELKGKREIEKAEAQQITRERDEAFNQLDKFMYRLRSIARVVLEEKPEHLEKVGILYRSAPIRKKEEEENQEPDDSMPIQDKQETVPQECEKASISNPPADTKDKVRLEEVAAC